MLFIFRQISETQVHLLCSAALAAVLAHGVPALVTVKNKKSEFRKQLPDASHLCKNKLCVSPLHVIFESNQQNQRRDKCNNTNAFACRHPNAKCIFVRLGRFLTCRNDSTREHQVCANGCSLRCFGTFQFYRLFCTHRFSFADFDEDAIAVEEASAAEKARRDGIPALAEQNGGDDLDEQEDGDDLAWQSESEEPTIKRARE